MRLVVEPVSNADWDGASLQLIEAHRLVRHTLHFNSLQVELDDASRSDSFEFDGES